MTSDPTRPSARLRRATLRDLLLYFELANDSAVRQNSFNQRPISFEEHRVWFGRKLETADAVMLVLELDDRAVGQIRFDIQDAVATISFALAADARGQGLGAYLLREGVRQLLEARPELQTIRGLVRPVNVASRRAFDAAGFHVVASRMERADAVVYEMPNVRENGTNQT